MFRQSETILLFGLTAFQSTLLALKLTNSFGLPSIVAFLLAIPICFFASALELMASMKILRMLRK